MPRVPQIRYDSAPPEVREAHDDHIRRHARITNMKRTLLNSLPAFHALMEWYPLRDTVQPFLGPRRLAVSPFRVPDEVYGRVAAHFDDAKMTALTAFGAIMVATNVFNNALEVELDEYLHPYRRVPAGSGHAG